MEGKVWLLNMKKNMTNGRDSFDSILPEYGRRKLLTYADSIRELADTFKETKSETQDGGSVPNEDRNEYIWQRKLLENKSLMAEHLQEMAQIMTSVAREARHCEPMGERRLRQIAHALKEVGVQLRNLYLIENESGKMEVAVSMKNVKKDTISVEDMGNLLSVLLNIRLVGAEDNPFFVGDEWKTFYYMEEAGYHVLTGVATAVKET